MMILPLMVSLLLGSFPVASAQPSDPDAPRSVNELRAERIAPVARPAIDGVLDEEVWATAEVATGFTQVAPRPGAPASQRTETLVLYDDTALYVGFRAYDTDPSAIVRQLARRDEMTVSDKVFVAVDSYGDGRTAFVFGVNAAGVKYDFLIYNDVQQDISWDAVWEVAVGELPEGGWSAEFRIPLSQLRYRSGAGPQAWGIQFLRDIPRNQEEVFWAPMSPDVSGMVSRFGRLHGVEGLSAPRRIEVQPYVASSLTRAPGDLANPFYRENALSGRVGADLSVGLTSDLTLSATVNPDFGQVEADPAVVNLSAFETFFQERRPFFVEGTDVFSFGQTRTYGASFRPTFFYSRRIGRAPQRSVAGPAYAYVDRPDQTTIAAAGKLSGKVGAWSVGVLDAVTLEEQARFVTPGGEAGTLPIEPPTNYFVGRVKRDFREGASVVGGILTSATRSLSDPAFSPLVARQASVAGVDFEHAWADRAWTVSGVLVGSHVAGDEVYIERLQRAPQRYFQRPDARHLTLDPSRTSLTGGYTELSVARTGGKLLGSFTLNAVTGGFEANDLGFQSRADGYSLTGVVAYNETAPKSDAFQFWGGHVYGVGAVNGAGERVSQQIGMSANARLRNGWGGGVSTTAAPLPVYTDRLTRGGPVALRPADASANAWVHSDSRRSVSATVRGFYRSEFGDEPEFDTQFGADLNVRPSATLNFSLSPAVTSQLTTDQFLAAFDAPAAGATFGRRYVFANLRQQSVSMGMRANWTFTPDLSLQFYARPFITSGRFNQIKEFAEPGTYRFTVYGEDRGTLTEVQGGYAIDPGDGGESFALPDPDFVFRSLRANAVFRWEYRPGSTVFLVWQQQRTGTDPYGDLDYRRDVGALFREDVHNIFLIKLSYWLAR